VTKIEFLKRHQSLFQRRDLRNTLVTPSTLAWGNDLTKKHKTRRKN